MLHKATFLYIFHISQPSCHNDILQDLFCFFVIFFKKYSFQILTCIIISYYNLMKTFALMFILPAAIIIIPFKQAYNNDLKKYIKMQAIAHTKD